MLKIIISPQAPALEGFQFSPRLAEGIEYAMHVCILFWVMHLRDSDFTEKS